MMSASDHLASWCWMTVLPVPKPRDRRAAALAQGEEGVDDPLSRKQGFRDPQPLPDGPGAPHGPELQHPQLPGPLGRLDDCKGIPHGILARPYDALHPARHAGGHQDGMAHQGRLHHLADGLPWKELLAGLYQGLEVPSALEIQGIHLLAPADPGTALGLDGGKGALDPIEDAPDEAGPQPDREGLPREDHRGSGLEHGGVLVDLEGGAVPQELHHLPHQTQFPHPHHLVHPGPCHARGVHHGPADAGDLGGLHGAPRKPMPRATGIRS